MTRFLDDPLLLPLLVLLTGAAAAYALWTAPRPLAWKRPGERPARALAPEIFARLIGGSLGAALGLVLVPLLGLLAAPLGTVLALAGYLAPGLMARYRHRRTRAQIEGQVLPFTGLLAALAGLPETNLYDALYLAAAESEGELAVLVGNGLRSVGLGQDLVRHLEEQVLPFGDRNVRRLVALLKEHVRRGEPLAGLLRELEVDLFDARLLALREQLAQADLRLTLVGMLLLVPALYLVSVVPALLHALKGLQ